jgi:predicted transglutaminase-like cysteine proteinase
MQFFCRAHPAECAGSSSSSVAMSENLLSLLQSVTKRVNGRIRYKAESVDMWTLNPSRGDCEDFALSKRSALIKAGVPAGALRVALTYTRRGAPHAVLVVKTSRGNYVLDNLNNQVVSLGASGYRIRMMSGANPLNWTRG